MKYVIRTDLTKYPTINDFYTNIIFDDPDKIVEFSEMTYDIYKDGYKAGFKKVIKRIIIGGIVVAVIIKIKNKEIKVEIEEDQQEL